MWLSFVCTPARRTRTTLTGVHVRVERVRGARTRRCGPHQQTGVCDPLMTACGDP